MINIKNTKDVEDFFVYLEKEFQINNWKYNNIHIWPFLRISLEYYLYEKINSYGNTVNSEVKNNNFYKLKKQFAKLLSFFQFHFWLLRLNKKKPFLFVSADHYRATYQNERVNKFFDVLIEKYALNQYAAYIENNDNPSNIKKKFSNLNIGFSKGAKYYLLLQSFKKTIGISKRKMNFEHTGYEQFISFLFSIDIAHDFAKNHNIERLQKTLDEWYNFYQLFEILIKKLKVEKIFTLCYFDKYRMALIAAANSKSIPVYEMQHGPLKSLAYYKWTKIPESGYDMLPKNYLCWNLESKRIIDSWAYSIPTYKSIISGNPWVEYWKSENTDYKHSNYILYTLQASEPEEAFSENLVQCIKKLKMKWFVRLHPNWLLKKKNIIEYLEASTILEYINIEDATADPLPLLLKNALVHVTAYSGSTIEAEQFGIFTILLSEWGESLFDAQIKQNTAAYLNPKNDDFMEDFCKLVDIEKSKEKIQSSNNIDFVQIKAVFSIIDK
jgi:hypothetical protein